MKQPWEWNEVDIQSMVDNEVPEGPGLDYKACDALQITDGKKNEISKDVSAFANSGGGTIIYGVIEDPDTHKPLRVDNGYELTGPITKEWLEQVINSRIQPKIHGVRINQVSLTNGRCIFVVYVPQSYRAPHQASDKKFYKRYNFESVPMEGYEIRDVINRSKGPLLSLEFILRQSRKSREVPDLLIPVLQYKIGVKVQNESITPAEFAIATIWLPRPWIYLKSMVVSPTHRPSANDTAYEIPPGKRVKAVRLEKVWTVYGEASKGYPIFRGRPFDFFEFDVLVPDIQGLFMPIFWTLEAPHMTQVNGQAFVNPSSQRVFHNPDRAGDYLELWIDASLSISTELPGIIKLRHA